MARQNVRQPTRYFTLSGRFETQTPKAVLLFLTEEESVWIPKSQVKDKSHEWDEMTPGDIVDLEVPEWWVDANPKVKEFVS